MLCYLNGQFLPRADASIPVEDRGFMFGDGVYEVWRVVNGQLFELDRHRARLEHGLGELRITRPPIAERDELLAVADRLLYEDQLLEGEATFYLEITRGAAPRTHQFPSPDTPPTVFAMVNRFVPPDGVRETGAAAITLPDVRWLRCNVKTIQLLPNVLAKQAAADRGAIDALLVRDGVVTESSHANVLAVFGGTIRTHPLDHRILPGITRAVVLEIARELGMPVVEEAFRDTEIASADEIFLAGTTADVMPIVRVDDETVGRGTPGPIAVQLHRELRARMDQSARAVR